LLRLFDEMAGLAASPMPTIRILAGYSKHRREDIQPIRPDLAAILRPWLSGRDPKIRLWRNLQQSSSMIREDLLAARLAWLQEAENDSVELQRRKESDVLAYRDRRGFVADFHALRHTFITQVVSSGAPMKAAQELARHSTPTLTLGRYAHATIQDTSRAMNAMPGMAGVAKPESTTGDTPQKLLGDTPKSSSGESTS